MKAMTNIKQCSDYTVLERHFEFGNNWRRFLFVIDDERIENAKRSLQECLSVSRLDGVRMLDIGCGSGLFSLAARRLGAQVHSFDFDPQSVDCAKVLRNRFFPGDTQWNIERGSVLDETYLKLLGQFDLVYSWGVLHHTGDMWRALEYASRAVATGGRLVVSIYNDMGNQSIRWRRIKAIYNKLPSMFRLPFAVFVMLPIEVKEAFIALVTLKPDAYIHTWTEYKKRRGMSRWHDLIDWVGGYPYEVAKPEQLLDFFRKRGFNLKGLKTCGSSLGCNELLFERNYSRSSAENNGSIGDG
jgi:2-polyprenyl-3-methyl-5-hydroxy-6-metoxy-1,4-benzoquinol methylase